MSLLDQPELQSLHRPQQLIRLSSQQDVPTTARVMRLIDTSAFQRLRHIKQLGLVQLVYPSANHSRFEHTLGVYHLALRYINRLSGNSHFQETVAASDIDAFLIAALLHDIGHWPFCHPIEDMELSNIRHHETLVPEILSEQDISGLLDTDWDCDPQKVARILSGQSDSPAELLLNSLISGPIDIDKLDYLPRDSANCGVPYGNNFDQDRLIASLTISPEDHSLAITDKGRTAAELMVFARYVMFSEVYWHRTVRSATAMFQHLFQHSAENMRLESLHHMCDNEFVRELINADGTDSQISQLLFGRTRVLYKSVLEFDHQTHPHLHSSIAHSSYATCQQIALLLHQQLTKIIEIPRDAIILDAPPAKLEVQFDVNVLTRNAAIQPLTSMSPVVQTLATEQFDKFVKRVRVFIHPDYCNDAFCESQLVDALNKAVDALG